MKKILFCLAVILLIGCSNRPTGQAAAEIPSEQTDRFDIYFCPRHNCTKALAETIEDAKSYVHCAFFDIDLPEVIHALTKKSKDADVKIVVDNENYGEITGPGVRQDTSSQYSHNKFCIIDGKTITTGSMNPTENDAYKNNNNLIIINSKYLAINYEDEFQELWNGDFGKGGKVKYPVIYLNNIMVENYFCPEDQCSKQAIKEIDKAKQSIYFLTFSFTHEGIADALLFKGDAEIKGIIEKMNANGLGSQYSRLKDFGIDVKTDNNKYKLHHKVFIIDNETVITGSFNPSKNAEWNNDENILIIHSKEAAKLYINEFERLW